MHMTQEEEENKKTKNIEELLAYFLPVSRSCFRD